MRSASSPTSSGAGAVPLPRSRPPEMGAAPSLADVRAWDATDPLRAMRERFDLPAGVIYLDGNSLGAAPRAVHARLAAVLAEEWAEGLVRSWNRHDWIGA